MADNPRATNKDSSEGRCRSLEEECQDCRDVELSDVKTTHFTVCRKPWRCLSHPGNRNRQGHLGGINGKSFRLCMATHNAWFRLRMLVEETWASRLESYVVSESALAVRNSPNLTDEQTYGYCGSRSGLPHYESLVLPDSNIGFGTRDIPI